MTGIPDPAVRDRATALLTLAEKASEGPWHAMLAHQLGHEPLPQVDVGCWTWTPRRPAGVPLDQAEVDSAYIVAACNAFPDVARRLLEALDTIDIAGSLHHAATPNHAICVTCGTRWPCPTWQALHGGNE